MSLKTLKSFSPLLKSALLPLASCLLPLTNPVAIFLVVLVIILLAPVLLNRLKIPHIVGMIAAGVAVGPYGLHILDRDSSFEIFGQVGLLYLMFLAGLEIDMYHLKLNLRKGMSFGLLTFFIPMVMGVAASVWLLHTGWVTAFLLASMYASHTLIAYPVAARYGVTKSPAVLISVVGTIIAVIGALLVLAACVNIHETGAFQLSAMLWLVLKLGLYGGAVLYVYPRLTRWFFKSYGEKVTQYVFILAMVFFSAWISGVIGLEPVLGAFYAGLVINRYVPANSPLMTSIEFVGNALFIPYFLIGVGMMINLSVIFSGNTLLVAMIMLAVALASKWIAAWAGQKINGMQGCDRRMMFGLTTAHTAVALAVVTIGYNMVLPDGTRMMDETILNGTVLVILVTCAIAPVITSAAAARIRVRQLSETPEESVTASSALQPERTLVPVSNPITAAALAELALMLNQKRGTGKSDLLFALHVRNSNSASSKAIGQSSLKLARKAAAAADTPMEIIERYDLNTATGITNTIEERDITRVVMGMHRKATVIDTFLGGKTEALLRSTNRMVIVARTFIPVNTLTRILVYVPEKAQFETGFRQWAAALGRLTQEVGCRITFYCSPDQEGLLRGVLHAEGFGIRHTYIKGSHSDNLTALTRDLRDDDLLAVVTARANSVSFTSELAEMPALLQRYFGHNNLMVIYPSQFGHAVPLPSFTDPLQTDLASAPPSWWRLLTQRKSQRKL